MAKEGLVITPPTIIGDRTKKGSLLVDGPATVILVRDSRIFHWDGVTTMLALTELRSRANRGKVPRERGREYNRAIQAMAKKKDFAGMRKVVAQFPDCVVQPEDVQELSDAILEVAAMYMTEAL